MGTPNKLAQVLRDAVIPIVSHLAPFQHAFVKRLSELGIAYQSATSMTRWLLGQPERLLSNSVSLAPASWSCGRRGIPASNWCGRMDTSRTPRTMAMAMAWQDWNAFGSILERQTN